LLFWLGILGLGLQSLAQGNAQQQAQQQGQQQAQRGNQGGRRGGMQSNQGNGAQGNRRGMVQYDQVGPQFNRSAPAPPIPPAGGQGNRIQIGQQAAPGFGQPGRGGMAMPNRPGLPPGNQSLDPASIKMRLEGQDITAEIRNTPLQQVLGELAAWSGIVFEIESQENPMVSVNFYRVPVSEAVDRLTAHENAMSFYKQDSAGQNHLTFVHIISQTPRPAPPSLQYIGTGAVTKRSDDVVDSPEQAMAVLAGSANLVARQKAVEVLIVARSPVAIQALRAVLADPAVEIKAAAIDGLASIGAREALPQILRSLKDSHPGVRQSALLAVGRLGDASNVKDLRPLLHDPDASVAASADIVIQKLSIREP
jgi:hypothetical protein